MKRVGPALLMLALVVSACAAEKKSPEAPAQAMAPPESPSGAGPAKSAAAPATEATQSAHDEARPTPAPVQPAAPTPPAPAATAPPGGATSSRAVAMVQASREIESAQRELDVAGGDCRNACRALGSMDRAAGHLCGLAQSNDERRRCDDAKTRVYSARDKVKNTCGTCPDITVDRSAPVPSH